MSISKKFFIKYLVIVTLCFIPLEVQGGTYVEKLKQMQVDDISFEECLAYLNSLEPQELLKMGKELGADPLWSQPASGFEYWTGMIMETYVKKVGDASKITKSIIQEISDNELPARWRYLLRSWFNEHLRKSREPNIDDENVVLYLDYLLTILKDPKQELDIRIETNISIAYLLTSRYISVIKEEKKNTSGIYERYKTHFNELLKIVQEPSSPEGIVGSCIFLLSHYHKYNVTESREIRDKFLELFKNRKQFTPKNQVVLAEVIVETGNKAIIKEELLKLKEEIEDTELRRKIDDLLKE